MELLKEAKDKRDTKINKIEKMKGIKNPLDLYKNLESLSNQEIDDLSDEDKSFTFKCFGLFYKKDDTFMLRVRITAGQLTNTQAIKLGELAIKYGQDYIDITTRQQIEFRYLELKDLYILIKEVESIGLTTFQTGIDNFRNIVTSSFDGLGVTSIIKTKEIIDEIQSLFLKKEEWIGTLPRKFNVAILGNTINDCNIYGHDCCFLLAENQEEIGFNLYLGGKVGVQAQDSGLFIRADEVVPTFEALINIYKEYGFRDNRNKNRLHFLIQSVGIENFVKALSQKSTLEYKKSGKILATQNYVLDDSGVFDLADDLKAVHLSVPSGILKGSDLKKAGELAAKYDGELRLSVEQSLYLVVKSNVVDTIQNSDIFKRYSTYQNSYFNHQIACAGVHNCSFGVIPNKQDAIDMANFLQNEVPLKDAKIRMYWSACPKGCGIQSIADIGFEGCKAKDDEGNKVYGVHIYLGGKATKESKEARVLYKSVPLENAKTIVKRVINLYKNESLEKETFEEFDTRVLCSLDTQEVINKIDKY